MTGVKTNIYGHMAGRRDTDFETVISEHWSLLGIKFTSNSFEIVLR